MLLGGLAAGGLLVFAKSREASEIGLAAP
ncbi:hypothetical protein [Aeoliella straminimaris]